jgi:hypothetical protein
LAVVILAVFLGVVLGALRASADEKTGRKGGRVNLEMALQYDFYLVKGTQVSDGSGHQHHGQLHGGKIVEGPRKPAVQLDGKGIIAMAGLPESLNPAFRTFAIGAQCKPVAGDGVIAVLGDRENGFCLFLKEGVPHFAVRAKGELAQVSGPEALKMDQWVHLVGTMDAKGELWLMVNGWPVARAKGQLISQKPGRPFRVGADTGAALANYKTPLHWQGLLGDVRLYWGFLDRNENREILGDWADLPGCGCGK